MIDDVTEQPDRRPGRPRDARVDAAIATAAQELVAEHGFAGATIEEVAARAGVGKAAIYRRWRTREALFFAVAMQEVPDIATPDTGSLRDDIVAVFTELARQMIETGPGSLLTETIAEAARNPAMREYFTSVVAQRRRVCGHVVFRAAERGELKEGIDPDLVVDLLSSPIFYRKLIAFDPADGTYIENVVDAVLGGVQG